MTAGQTKYLGLDLIDPKTAVREAPGPLNSNASKIDEAVGNTPTIGAYAGAGFVVPVGKAVSVAPAIQYFSHESMKPTPAHPTRLTIPQTGIYEVSVGVGVADMTSNNVIAEVRQDANNDPQGGYRVLYSVAVASIAGSGPRATTTVPLSAGSYLELFVFHTSQTPVSVLAGQGLTFTNLVFLRPVPKPASEDTFHPKPNTPINLPGARP